MSDPIRADISTFETLQSCAHESMGLSGIGVFNDAIVANLSSNTKGILSRLPKFKVHYDNIEDMLRHNEKMQSEKVKRPSNASAYDALIERNQTVIQRTRGHLVTEAKNIATLIDMERRRLGFDYKPGSTVSKEGLEPAIFRERKQFADAVNAFHSGRLPDGTPFTAFLR